jgi:DNA polymerase III subunit epsilon
MLYRHVGDLIGGSNGFLSNCGMYAVVDIETTGGNARLHRILEIAIIVHDGQKEITRFSSLVNPGTGIPRFIQGLTGILPEMVESAPAFEDIAVEVHSLLRDHVFVAHNVSFDYPFVQAALERAGLLLDTPRLCTVRASRKLMPDLGKYSLGRLAEQLGIPISDRHRAYGDAEATAEVLKRLVSLDQEGVLEGLHRKSRRKIELPPLLPAGILESLPESPGVYYFHDQSGKVMYVGKAVDIKRRVKGHFTSSDFRFERFFNEQLSDISFQETGSELMANLMESMEIKRLWPKYNSAGKFRRKDYGLCLYEDQKGYLRLTVAERMKGARWVKSLGYKSRALEVLHDLIEQFQLCANLCHLEKNSSGCSLYQVGQCMGACLHKEPPEEYNERVLEGLQSLEPNPVTLLIRLPGRQSEESALLLVEKGRFCGYAFVPHSDAPSHWEEALNWIKRSPHDPELDRLVGKYLELHPEGHLKPVS